ncbi:MAG: terminase family protein [Bacteroidota bacterium]
MYVNEKQDQFLKANQRIKVFQAGRGTGKTTVMADEVYDDYAAMPKAKNFLLGKTFGQVYTKFLPELISRWEEYGLKEHTSLSDPGHYVICKRPPDWYQKPYKIPKKFDNIVTFINGFSLELLSFDRPDLGRGGSYDGGYIDEAGLIDYTVFTQTILPLLRGNKHLFKHPRRFALRVFSSMPWKESGKWVVRQMRQLAKNEPSKYFFLQSSARDNIEVLGQEYFDDMKGLMDPLTYAVEIENEEISKIPNSFYIYLDESIHVLDESYDYNYDDSKKWSVKLQKEIDPDKEIDASFDFNSKFTSCSLWQDHCEELRAVGVQWVKYDLIENLVDQICNTLSSHPTKHVRIFGGKDGHTVQKQINQYSMFERIQKRFNERGWNADVKANISTSDIGFKLRHSVVNNILKEEDPSLPRVRFCYVARQLYVSMSMAPVKDDFDKDKSSELDEDIAQEYATHLSDTFDNYIVPKCSSTVLNGNTGSMRAH